VTTHAAAARPPPEPDDSGELFAISPTQVQPDIEVEDSFSRTSCRHNDASE
jgi:hypothetical protein